MDKKDIKDVLEMIKKKLERDAEAGCLFGDCDDCPQDGIYYIIAPPRG